MRGRLTLWRCGLKTEGRTLYATGVDFTFSREWRISGYDGYDFSVLGETQGNATQRRRRIFRWYFRS